MSIKRINSLLVKARRNCGLTQVELAEKVGVSVEAVKRWEQGRRNMTLINADKVFKALGITVTIGKEAK